MDYIVIFIPYSLLRTSKYVGKLSRAIVCLKIANPFVCVESGLRLRFLTSSMESVALRRRSVSGRALP